MNWQSIINWLLGHIQIVMVVLIFVLPTLGKLWQRANKARQMRSVKMQIEQERIEGLRTGRISEVAKVPTPIAIDQLRIGDDAGATRERDARTLQSQQQRTNAQGRGAMGTPASRSIQPNRPLKPQVTAKLRVSASPSTTAGLNTGPNAGLGAGSGTLSGSMRQIRLPGGIIIEVPDESTPAPRRAQAPAINPAPTGLPAAPSKVQGKQKRLAKPHHESSTTRSEADRKAATAASDAVMAAAYGEAAGPRPTASMGASMIGPGTRATAKNGPRASLLGLAGPNATRDEIRRAFLLSEVLGRPKADSQ